VPTASELEALERVAYQDGFRRGHEDGFERGQREGLAAGQAQARELAECLRAVLSQFEDPLEKFDGTVEQALVELAMAVARQLVRLEFAVNPELVVAVVRESLQALPLTARGVRVYLEPEDAALVRAAVGSSVGRPDCQLIEDPELQRGDCRIESDSSRIDADVESRLAAVIAQVLGGERGGGPVAKP
jgi:flagellar assembly protein FliH